jgi:hypothetical protein
MVPRGTTGFVRFGFSATRTSKTCPSNLLAKACRESPLRETPDLSMFGKSGQFWPNIGKMAFRASRCQAGADALAGRFGRAFAPLTFPEIPVTPETPAIPGRDKRGSRGEEQTCDFPLGNSPCSHPVFPVLPVLPVLPGTIDASVAAFPPAPVVPTPAWRHLRMQRTQQWSPREACFVGHSCVPPGRDKARSSRCAARCRTSRPFQWSPSAAVRHRTICSVFCRGSPLSSPHA